MRYALILLLMLAITACTSSATSRDAKVVEEQQKTYQINQPVPMFNWSQERDTVIQLYSMRNEARQTYTVITSQGTGQIIFECPSRGTAIAADTQLTNPLMRDYPQSSVVVEQPEPNGLFSSKNTDATWVLCVRSNGEIAPVYTEQKVTQFPFAVRRDDTGKYVDAESGSSSMRVELNRGGSR